MNLIVISDPQFLPNETKAVILLFKAGLKRFHLRKPQASQEEVEAFLTSLPSEYHSKIVLHNHLSLANSYHVGGIHFGSANKIKYNPYHTYSGIISWATHQWEELQLLPQKVNHAFLSPIFPSISKKGYQGNLEMEEVSHFLKGNKQKHFFEITAMGGITPEKIPLVKEWGFDGAAVLGYLWEDYKKDLSLSKLEKDFLKLKASCL